MLAFYSRAGTRLKNINACEVINFAKALKNENMSIRIVFSARLVAGFIDKRLVMQRKDVHS